MEPTQIKLLCPVCGRGVDRLSDLDYLKNEYPDRVLICLNDKYAHYIVRDNGHYLAKYNNQINFLYDLYLGLS